MNFSSLAGCQLKARFGILKAIPVHNSDSGAFVYNSLLNGSYKAIIESQLPVDAIINFMMNGNQIVFEHKGFKEPVQAVAVVEGEPLIVKVILVNEEVIAETLDIKYPSVKTGLQAIMQHSDLGGRPKINKSLVLAINTEDYSVKKIFIEADATEQENIDAKIDFITDLSKKIEISRNKGCDKCGYKAICDNKTLPVVSCSTCAFYRIGESRCALNNAQGIKCEQHLYNPTLLVNHEYQSVDVQNLFIQYGNFVNSNNPVMGQTALTSEEMYSGHKFDKVRILDENLQAFKRDFGAKIVD